MHVFVVFVVFKQPSCSPKIFMMPTRTKRFLENVNDIASSSSPSISSQPPKKRQKCFKIKDNTHQKIEKRTKLQEKKKRINDY